MSGNYPRVHIPEWPQHGGQYAHIGDKMWSVSRLIALSGSLQPFLAPVGSICVDLWYDEMCVREMTQHYLAIKNADLSFPIILDETGTLMDGRHRMMQAMARGKTEILCVRFQMNPEPCKIESKEAEAEE